MTSPKIRIHDPEIAKSEFEFDYDESITAVITFSRSVGYILDTEQTKIAFDTTGATWYEEVDSSEVAVYAENPDIPESDFIRRWYRLVSVRGDEAATSLFIETLREVLKSEIDRNPNIDDAVVIDQRDPFRFLPLATED